MKRRRNRVLLCLTLAGLICLIAGAGYWLRSGQLDRQAHLSRQKGLLLFEQGQYLPAMHQLGVYLRRFPQDTEALFNYAVARQHNPEPNGKHLLDAMALHRRVLSLRPDHVAATHQLLELYGLTGFYTEALELSRQRLLSDPDDRVALRSQVAALRSRRDFDSAAAAAGRLAELDPQDIEAQLLSLEVLLQTEHAREAVLLRIEELKQRHPADVRFIVLESIALLMLGERQAATRTAQALSQTALPDSTTVRLMVQHCDRLGLFEQSVLILERSSADGQLDERTRQQLAARLYQLGRYSDVLAVEGRTAQLTVLHALANLGLARREEAAAVAHSLDDRDPTSSGAAWKPILLLLSTENPHDASLMRACRKAVALLPDDPHLLMIAADVYGRLGELQAMSQALQEAARYAPAWPEPLVRLAELSVTAGSFEVASQVAEAALARAPEHIEGRYVLATAQTALVEPADRSSAEIAGLAIERFAGVAPEDARLVPLRAWHAARLGNSSEAQRLLADAYSQSPALPSAILLHLAEISREHVSEMESRFLELCEAAHGLSGTLLLMKARALHAAGYADRALALLDEAVQADGPAREDLATARAQFFDWIDEPRAAGAWIELADTYPSNVALQWRALDSKHASSDLAFVDRTLRRLRDQVGDQSPNWRMAHSRLLLARATSADSPDVIEAALTLSSFVAEAPNQIPPRLLLAEALQRLGNADAALDHLIVAAGLDSQSADLALKLARLLAERGENVRALIYVERVLGSKKADAQQLLQAVELASALGDPHTAIRVLESRALSDRSPSPLLLANLYRQVHEYDKVDALCLELLRKTDAAGLKFVIDYNLWRQRPEAAAAALAKLDELEVDFVSSSLIRGSYALHTGDVEGALEHFAAATAHAPRHADAWKQLVEACLISGRFDEAVEAARRAAIAVGEASAFGPVSELMGNWAGPLSPDVGRIVVWLLEHPEHFSVGKRCAELLMSLPDQPPDQTLAELQQLALAHPRMLPLQQAAARLHLNNGRWERAIQIATNAAAVNANDVELARLKALALLSGQRWSEAVAAGINWKRLAPVDALVADLLVSQAHLKAGQVDRAIQVIAEYDAERVSDLPVKQRLVTQCATLMITTGEFSKAAGIMRPLLTTDTEVQLLWLAAAANLITDSQEALSWLREVESAIWHEGFSGCLALVDAAQTAADRLRHEELAALAAQLRNRLNEEGSAGPELTPDQWCLLGMLNERCRDKAAAVVAYQGALLLNPTHAIAANNLALLLSESDPDEALRLARIACDNGGLQSASFLDTLADVHERRGEIEEALATARRALEAAPNSPAFKLRLARLLIVAGESSQAASVLDEVERSAPSGKQAGGAVVDELARLRSQLR